MKRRIGILLSGCGTLDGTDPHEAVLSMLEIQSAGHEAVCLSLDSPQLHVVDHTSGEEVRGESRAQLPEAARLVRGKIHRLAEISPKLLDALVIPGGQGSAKNLMEGYGGLDGPRPLPQVASFLVGVHESGGSIGAISLAEFVVTGTFGPFPGGKGCLDVGPDEVLEDRDRRLCLTPGGMLARNLPEMRRGIASLVSSLEDLLAER